MVGIDYFKVGLGFLNTQNYEKAIEFFTRCININRTDSASYDNIGYAYFCWKKDLRAIEYFKKAIEYNPNFKNAYTNLAYLYRDTLKHQEALNHFLIAHKIDEKDTVVLENIINIYLQQKRLDLALDYCKKFNKLSPNDDYMLLLSAQTYLGMQKYKEAILCYDRLFTGGYESAEAYNNLGYCCLKVGELARAKYYLNWALSLRNNYPYSLNSLGYIKFLQKKYADAFELINKSLEYEVSNAYAYKNRALVNLALGHKVDAYQDLILARKLGYQEYHNDEVEELLSIHFGE